MGNFSESRPVVGILGGGPAGMSCALWLRQMGLSPYIIERNAAPGGQLLNVNRVNHWVLGLPGQTGPELASLYGKHISAENIPVNCNTQLTALEATAAGYRLMLQGAGRGQTSLPVQALVIATGVRVLCGEIFKGTPGFDELHAEGLIGCFPTSHLDRLELLQGKTVAVIGGGDNAHFTVYDVAAVAERAYLLIRSGPTAQAKIRQQVQGLIEQGRVVEYPGTEVGAFRQTQGRIELSLTQSGLAAADIDVDMVFIRTGFAPNSEFVDSLSPIAHMAKQAGGYIWTDAWRRTSVASIYAIGDVASPDLQAVVTAVADGALAARAIVQDLGARA
jgi:thioredoxin reductase (NADPH)